MSFEDYLYDGTGSYFRASVSEASSVTVRKGQSPSGRVTFLLRCRAKDDRWVYAELSWGGADTDCTQTYTAKFNSTYNKVNVPVTLTRAATSGHTWGDTWTMVSGSTTQHERECTHPVCVQTDICEAAWTSCTSNGNGTHTFTCSEGHTVTVNCSGGTATCVSTAVCQYCNEPYGSKNANNHNWGDWYMSDGSTTEHERKCQYDACQKKETCEAQWDSYENVGDGQHKQTCIKGHSLTVNCSGGTATCISTAVCQYCNTAYGSENPNNHSAVIILPAVAPTYTETGLTEGSYCDDCGQDIVLQRVFAVLPPQTGDSSNLVLYLALMATGLTGAILLKRKFRKN